MMTPKEQYHSDRIDKKINQENEYTNHKKHPTTDQNMLKWNCNFSFGKNFEFT